MMKLARVVWFVGGIGGFLPGAAVSMRAGMVPVQWQCESKANPAGLGEISPRLSWQVVATNAAERGQYQSACQIQVASTPQLLASNVADLWDTGMVATNVVLLKFEMTNPASENGYCGYAAIGVFGTPSLAPVVPPKPSLELRSPTTCRLTVSDPVAGRNYVLQSATNLAAGPWATVTNLIPGQTTFVWRNLTVGAPATFFRIYGY